MELEVKHLSPYLPYGLKIITYYSEDDFEYGIMSVDNGMNGLCDIGTILDKTYQTKPLLFPITDITKEINFGGVKFIPIMRMFGEDDYEKYKYNIKVEHKKYIGKRATITVDGIEDMISFGMKHPLRNTMSYENYVSLFSWHFDMFGLIESGLAEDRNNHMLL